MLVPQKFHTIGVRCPLPFHEVYLWLPLTGSYNDSLEVDSWLGQITLVFWPFWSNIYFAFSSLFSDGRQPLKNGLSGTANNSAIATPWRQEWHRLEISRKLKADFLRKIFRNISHRVLLTLVGFLVLGRYKFESFNFKKENCRTQDQEQDQDKVCCYTII